MISVPNTSISIRAQNGASSVETRPAWFADMFRAVWGGRLDPEHGVEVSPVDPSTPSEFRYSTFIGFDTAERETIAFFTGGNPKEYSRVAAVFNRVFPDGLKKVIEQCILDDAKRAKEVSDQIKHSPVPHQSYLDAEVSISAALELQRKGYPVLSAIQPNSILLLVECGLNPTEASRVQDLVDTHRASLSRPVKAAAKAVAETVSATTL